jgi:hypothetical protein
VPSYSVTFDDAVTGDNAFTAADGNQYWTVDAGADDYQNDVYERPTAQTYQVRRLADGEERFAAAEYLENLDIVRARAGFDDQYLYVSIEMNGLNKVTSDGASSYEGLKYRYGFRISNEADGGHGFLVVADAPQFKSGTTFGSVGTFAYFDKNGDVGGTGRDVTKQDREAEVGGNGYESVVIADGKTPSGKQALWVRVDPNNPNTVEFVLDYGRLGFSRDNLASLPSLDFEANKGLQDPGNYAWNDEYTKSEAGSPYRASVGNLSKSEFGTQGLGNIYELDTLRGGPLFAPASLSGFVYVDGDDDGVREEGERGIGGVTITLTGIDDQGNEVFATVMTDEDGFYSFDNLRPGTYQIRQTQPDTFLDGTDTIGTQGGDTEDDLFFNIFLSAGEKGEENNFGEIETFLPS